MRLSTGTLISTPTLVLSMELAEMACLHTYGFDKTLAMLARKPNTTTIFDSNEPSPTEKLVLFTDKLLREKNWLKALLVWLCLMRLIKFVPFDINNHIVSSSLTMLLVLYGYFPIIYIGFWIVRAIVAKNDTIALTEAAEIQDQD